MINTEKRIEKQRILLDKIRNDINNITYDVICEIPNDVIHNYFTESEIDIIIKKIIQFYREAGFPYYEYDDKKMRSDYHNALQSKISDIEISDNELQQNMSGLYFLNFFHPEMWEVRCNKSRTPMEVFNDDSLLYNAIRKRISMSDSKMAPFNIRKSIKVFSGSQSVSNFRPTIAKYIYDKYAPINATVLDPCMGYGGRMLGAYMSTKVVEYTGIDPNGVTIKNNIKIYDELKQHPYPYKELRFIELPFEDFETDEKYDLIFTSPPYFNIEKYSNDSTQSWVRYPTLEGWLDGFLHPLVEKSYNFLKSDGYFIINIDGGSKIIDPFVEMAEEFFTLVETKYMRLSKVLGNRQTNKDKFKLEPIFIFKK